MTSPMTYPMNVFDEEMELALDAESQSWAMLSEAQCTLEEARAFQSFTGLIN